MFVVWQIIFIFTAIITSIGLIYMNAVEIGCTIIIAVCTYVGTVLTIKHMFRDVLKEAKENATERALLKQQVMDSEKAHEDFKKSVSENFMAYGKRLDSTEEHIGRAIDRIDRNLENMNTILNNHSSTLARLDERTKK